MEPDRDNCPLHFDDLDDFTRLRDLLAGVDFSDRGVAEALDLDDARSLSASDVPTLLRRTAGGTPLETLIRLFLIDTPTEVEATRAAVAPMTLEGWIEAGLVEIQDFSVVSLVKLLPFQELILAFDQPRRIQTGLSPNYVMGIGSSTLTLANLTVRRPAKLTLDLGTGCGYLALRAAAHSTRVLAVDCNPRAVHVAAFNAKLNGLPRVECLEGDLFEPVAAEQFDLVVSNPPFVISPETRYIYRDSGMQGDEITRKIVAAVPSQLSEGGFCQILCNWAHLHDQPWQQRLAEWFQGTGCDAWVLRSETLDAAAYAAKWIRHTERFDTEQFDRRYDEWTSYYDRQGIEAVSGGLITMRRRSGSDHWFRGDDGPEKMLGPAGEDIVRGFELHDFLESVSDDQRLLQQRLRVSPRVRLQQEFEPTADGWSVAESRLQLKQGLAYSGTIDPYMARLIMQCDGKRRLAELVTELAAALQRDFTNVASICLDVIRRLIERGLLLPEQDDR